MVKYYSEWKGHDGKKHYGIVSYNSLSGEVCYASDYFFEKKPKA